MDPRGQADGGAVLVALAEDVEQALASGLRQGDVSELVDDEQADLGELGLEAESLFSSRASISSWTRWEAVAKRTERPFWQAARRRARAMCVLPTPLGPSRITFSQRVMYSPRGEFEDQHLAEHRDGLEVEAFELFDDGEACLLDALLDQAALAVDQLQLHQPGEELDMIQSLGRALPRQFLVFPQEGGSLSLFR